MDQSIGCPVCGAKELRIAGAIALPKVLECRGCGLQFVSPQPSDEALDAIYREEYYDAWGLKENEAAVAEMKRATFRHRFALVAPTLSPHDAVLDLGCATGYFLDVARVAGVDAFGVDLSEFASATAAERHGRDHIFHGEFAASHFPANPRNRFRAIFMSDFLEHVRDPRAVLTLAHERLEPHGTVVITCPRADSLSRHLFGRNWPHYKAEHLYFFSRDALTRLLTQVGFERVESHVPWKTLSVDYLLTQFARYPSAMSDVFTQAARRLPASLRGRQLPMFLGELLITARRRAGS